MQQRIAARTAGDIGEEALRGAIEPLADQPGALLPILHALQHGFGHIPEAALPLIAERLNLSRAEVHGVVSFYHDFRTRPAERPVVKLCRAEACQARGVETLAPRVEARRDVSVEPVYCLGLCASGPVAMVGDQLFARLDEARLDRLLDEVATA